MILFFFVATLSAYLPTWATTCHQQHSVEEHRQKLSMVVTETLDRVPTLVNRLCRYPGRSCLPCSEICLLSVAIVTPS